MKKKTERKKAEAWHFSGAQVKAARERAALTQADLAAAADISRQQLTEIETGAVRNPTVHTIEKLAQATNSDTRAFFISATGGTERHEKNKR